MGSFLGLARNGKRRKLQRSEGAEGGEEGLTMSNQQIQPNLSSFPFEIQRTYNSERQKKKGQSLEEEAVQAFRWVHLRKKID
jgi:hypothetical protein